MEKIIQKIKNRIRKGGIALFPLLHPETQGEKSRAQELRESIIRLHAEKNKNSTEKNWQNNLTDLEKNILERDPRTFLNWKVIIYTMFHECKKVELDYLLSRHDGDVWSNAISESNIGHPKPYPYFPTSSGNLIHHAYSLAVMCEAFDINLKNINTVFEFGGGYGSMTRLFWNLGFTGTYTIFDLPEFIALQKYYLSSLGLDARITTEPTAHTSHSIVLLSDTQKLAQQIPLGAVDMYVATWSLSESPVELRKKILQIVHSPTYILIAYQSNFGTTDNIAFFTEMMSTHTEYEWKTFPIAHLSGSFYLLGKRKNI